MFHASHNADKLCFFRVSVEALSIVFPESLGIVYIIRVLIQFYLPCS